MKLQLILLDDLFYRGTGPVGTSLTTYGRKYNTATSTLNLTANVAQNVPLGTVGTSEGITTDTENKLTIVDNGIYLIEFFVSGSASANTNLTVEVLQNANNIGSTTIVKSVTANNDTDFIASSINTLNAGDEIGLSVQSTTGVTLSLASGNNAYLNVIRIA